MMRRCCGIWASRWAAPRFEPTVYPVEQTLGVLADRIRIIGRLA
jgi:hypothetical protein